MISKVQKANDIEGWSEALTSWWSEAGLDSELTEIIPNSGATTRSDFYKVLPSLAAVATALPDFNQEDMHPDELLVWFHRARVARKLIIDGCSLFGRQRMVGEPSKTELAGKIIFYWPTDPKLSMRFFEYV